MRAGSKLEKLLHQQSFSLWILLGVDLVDHVALENALGSHHQLRGHLLRRLRHRCLDPLPVRLPVPLGRDDGRRRDAYPRDLLRLVVVLVEPQLLSLNGREDDDENDTGKWSVGFQHLVFISPERGSSNSTTLLESLVY